VSIVSRCWVVLTSHLYPRNTSRVDESTCGVFGSPTPVVYRPVRAELRSIAQTAQNALLFVETARAWGWRDACAWYVVDTAFELASGCGTGSKFHQRARCTYIAPLLCPLHGGSFTTNQHTGRRQESLCLSLLFGHSLLLYSSPQSAGGAHGQTAATDDTTPVDSSQPVGVLVCRTAAQIIMSSSWPHVMTVSSTL